MGDSSSSTLSSATVHARSDTDLVAIVFCTDASASWVLSVVGHPGHLRAAAVHEDVLSAGVAMVITVHLEKKHHSYNPTSFT